MWFTDRIEGNRHRIAVRAEDRRNAFAPPSSRRPREFDFEPDWDDDPGPRRRR
ncbi:hypothetical protein [Amycolatopsis sp. NPDC049868]|uniref:hypothetical protein n=1 Tax=Amycolatopsis sp. NPDC049868 TaxID=3363934 RepID=UPI0037B59785